MNLQNQELQQLQLPKERKTKEKKNKTKKPCIELISNERHQDSTLSIYLIPFICSHARALLNHSEHSESRTDGGQRDLCQLSSLLQLSHLHSVAQDSAQMAFQCLQGRRLHNFSGQPVTRCPDGKKHFLVFRRNLPSFSLWPFHKGA